MKRLNRLFWLVLFSVSYLLSNAQTGASFNGSAIYQKVISNTKVAGNVIFPADSKLTIRFIKNNISFDEEILTIPILSNNTFELKCHLSEPTTAIISYLEEEVKVYLEPGNNVSLSFDGRDFLSNLKFKGEGNLHNQYLLEFQKNFGKWDNDFIQYEMTVRDAEDYRAFMDDLRSQKWSFFQNYNSTKKEFSKDFISYIHAEIDYWWAYQLMNYRIQRPLLVKDDIGLELPLSYYSFLDELIINNDEALHNQHYVDFLEQYLELRQENLLLDLALENKKEQYYLVEAAMVIIMTEPDNPPVKEEIRQGSRLKYLGEQSDFKSKGMIGDELMEDYWYKVKTDRDTEGWVLGVGLKKLESETAAAVETEEKKDADSRIERFAVIKKDRLEFRETPYDPHSVISLLPIRMEVENLLNKTTETFDYKENGYSYKDNYLKVKTPDGRVGWVASLGVQLGERKVSNDIKPSPESSLTNTTYAKKYLRGKTLQYITAKALYWKTHLAETDMDELGREIAEYRANTEDETYMKIIKSAYEVGQLKGKGDKALVDSYSYSVLSSPLIAGQQGYGTYSASTTPVNRNLTEHSSTLMPYVDIDCRASKRPTTSTNLKGYFSLSKKAELLIYTESVLFQEKKFELKGTFNLDIPLAETVIAVLKYGNEEVNLYLEPGDKMEMYASGGELAKSLQLKGKGSAHNNYLLKSTIAFNDLQKEMKSKVRHDNADDFKSFMKKSLKKKHAYFDKSKKANKFTNDFKKFAEADIDYWYAYNLMNYTLEHPLYEGKEGRMKMPAKYYDFLKDIPVAQEGVLPNMNYTYFLTEYFKYLLDKEENKGMSAQKLADQFLTDEPYYYFMAKEMAIACKRGKAREMGPEILSFIETCRYEKYNDLLRGVYNESKELLAGTMAPDFELADVDGNKVSLSDFRGKVVYIDFWATWCMPCVRYLHQSQRIKQQFKDKDVVFLYVSLDEKEQKWKDFVKQNRLEGVHIFADSGDVYQSEIAKLYKVKQLPTFIMIDKEGKIAFNQAKNPGSSQLVDQINSVLSSPGF